MNKMSLENVTQRPGEGLRRQSYLQIRSTNTRRHMAGNPGLGIPGLGVRQRVTCASKRLTAPLAGSELSSSESRQDSGSDRPFAFAKTGRRSFRRMRLRQPTAVGPPVNDQRRSCYQRRSEHSVSNCSFRSRRRLATARSRHWFWRKRVASLP